MFKSFCLKALRLIVLTLLLLQMASGIAVASQIQSPSEVSSQSTEMKTKQEEMIPARSKSTTDQKKTATPNTKVPESVLKPQRSDTTRPVDPYSQYYEGIKKFNAEVYGKEG